MKLMNILKYGPGERGRRRKREKMFQAYAAQFAELGAWANDGALARRNYASYADYLAHQAQKLDGVAGRLNSAVARGGRSKRDGAGKALARRQGRADLDDELAARCCVRRDLHLLKVCGVTR